MRTTLITTLIVAALAIVCDIISLLASGVGIIAYRTARPATSLIQAVQGNDIPAVKSLLGAGANVDEMQGYSWHLGNCFIVACSGIDERYGQTALTEAVDAESVPMVTMLLDHDARIDLPDSHGQDALAHAMTHALTPHVWQSDQAILRLLLQRHRGAEETSIIPAMCTAANAATTESMQVFEMLLQRVGRIPGEIAGCAGSLHVLKYFLDHGLDPNARYQNGPTMLALYTQRTDPSLEATCDCSKLEGVYMVQLLLKHGADPRRGGIGALSALDQAHAAKRARLAELLITGKMQLRSEDGKPQTCPPISLCPRTVLPPELAEGF